MYWNQQLSVEQQVALSMGDDDADDEEFDCLPVLATGCTRKATLEVEKVAYLEAEPMGMKYNPLFEQ